MNTEPIVEKPHRGLELLVSFGLTNEDMYVTNLAHRVNNGEIPRPEKGSAEEFFIYNSGNLFNGYFYALAADYMINQTIHRAYDLSVRKFGEDNWLSKTINYFQKDQNRINVASGVLSSLAIGFFETTGIGNTPDLKDIPAGVVGALLHTGLRYISLKRFKKNHPHLDVSTG